MNIPFRQHHLFKILEEFEGNHYALDLFLRYYFRGHKAIGSKDRAFIADTCYQLIRWRGLLDAIAQKPLSWQTRFEALPLLNTPHPSLPHHIQVSFPKELFSYLENSFGLKKALDFCSISNTRAPTTIRVNTLRAQREELLRKWPKTKPCEFSKNGIHFFEKINFFADPLFKQGYFEIQDEGSQLLANLVNAKAGEHVLDFCAGAGGKSLAIAPKMKGKGQLYLHDIRSHILVEAKKRLKRAGIENFQTIEYKSPKLKKLKKKMDWVLVDAPCTGSGTYRRNPDMKWKWKEQDILECVRLQKSIFEQALSYVKEGGYIVFATCSIFLEENEKQKEYFLKTYPFLKQSCEAFNSWPMKDGMDGFYGVCFQKK